MRIQPIRQSLAYLETLHRPHQKLELVIVRNIFEWKGEIDVQYIAETAARIAQPYAESGIAQEAKSAIAHDAAPPGPADIGKNGAAHPYQPEGIPIGEHALLDRERPREVPASYRRGYPRSPLSPPKRS